MLHNGIKKWVVTFFSVFFCIYVSDSFAASFDCAKAQSKIEFMVCGNNELSILDEELSAVYKNVLTKNPSVRDSQRAWLKQRNFCETEQCVLAAYKSRISDLGIMSNEGEIQEQEDASNSQTDHVVESSVVNDEPASYGPVQSAPMVESSSIEAQPVLVEPPPLKTETETIEAVPANITETPTNVANSIGSGSTIPVWMVVVSIISAFIIGLIFSKALSAKKEREGNQPQESNGNTDSLEKQLKKMQDAALIMQAKAEKHAAKYDLVLEGKGPDKYLDSPYSGIVSILVLIIGGFTWIILSQADWWVITIAVLFSIGSFIAILNAYFKVKYRKLFFQYVSKLEEKYVFFHVNLVPYIHSLGMFTVDDVLAKTPATLLDKDFVELIITGEVNTKKVEKIDLSGGKTLYKSLDERGEGNIETVFLEID